MFILTAAGTPFREIKKNPLVLALLSVCAPMSHKTNKIICFPLYFFFKFRYFVILMFQCCSSLDFISDIILLNWINKIIVYIWAILRQGGRAKCNTQSNKVRDKTRRQIANFNIAHYRVLKKLSLCFLTFFKNLSPFKCWWRRRRRRTALKMRLQWLLGSQQHAIS